MERLTGRTKAGQAYFLKCSKEPCERNRECWVCDFFNDELAERLAAYEDIGVYPEQLHEISGFYLDRCKEINRLRAELAELKALKEKSVAKKPEPIDYEKYMDVVKNAKFLKGAYWCPNCKHVVRSGSYCDDCGQKLDWSE